jgi:hypothetical protein
MIHDARLRGIVIDNDKTVLLRIDSAWEQHRWILKIPRVVELKADNFRETNIIFELGIVWKTAIDDQLLATLMEPKDRRHADMARAKADILDGKRSLLFITTSYGCELVLLSESEPTSYLVDTEGEGEAAE